MLMRNDTMSGLIHHGSKSPFVQCHNIISAICPYIATISGNTPN